MHFYDQWYTKQAKTGFGESWLSPLSPLLQNNSKSPEHSGDLLPPTASK